MMINSIRSEILEHSIHAQCVGSHIEDVHRSLPLEVLHKGHMKVDVKLFLLRIFSVTLKEKLF
jgi:hypothetical protein